jgi:PIN domain nuclease of toxin-antitoxin system
VIVLDTHVWLWAVDAPQRLSRKAKRAVDTADRIGISAVSVFELVGLVERGRIRFDVPPRAWIRDALARERVEALPLVVEIAVDAAQLQFVSDPVDRIIYATARAEDAQLVTRDERLRAFDPARTVW